ncbi:hypothetical protein BD289DRAFT_456732 [Coniella lustricola]|uniref:Uncharacterized protein n=1 Tax=Coniella lustricola TaxID=2025994 RepID=A0A2T2ZUP7_9PEZI|nr:hypothetical protein BD289DRAFT_456732 [Coniella lustricola]
MDSPLLRPSAHSLQRPAVFVKVEFGVSWSAQHAPRTHGLEYKSRALRERNPAFPRTVPAPTTNYLDSQPPCLHFEPHSSLTYGRDFQLPEPRPNPAYLLPAPVLSDRYGRQPIEPIPEPPPLGTSPPRNDRHSRAHSAGSTADRHERGSSAPPPLSENNWDVFPGQTSAHASAARPVPRSATLHDRVNSDVWKDLPEVPSRFRLGEDDLPWESTWQFPLGFEPYLEPDPYLQRKATSTPSAEAASQRAADPARTPERSTSFQSFIESPPQNDDSVKRHDLEALGHAMMTVDNGFENQWWNQGERRPLGAVEPPPTTRQQVEEQMALGWVGALLPDAGLGDDSRRFTYPSPEAAATLVSPEDGASSIGPSYSNAVVSPMSTFSVPATQLSRSLSTRSDELWFGRAAARYA